MYCILLVYFPDNSNDNLDPRVAKVDDDNKNVDEKTIKDSDVSESNEIANQIAGEKILLDFCGILFLSIVLSLELFRNKMLMRCTSPITMNKNILFVVL